MIAPIHNTKKPPYLAVYSIVKEKFVSLILVMTGKLKAFIETSPHCSVVFWTMLKIGAAAAVPQ